MRNPDGPKALQDNVPRRKAAPMPEAVSPDRRIGDPTTKMRRLLATADFQVGGDARTRLRRESCSAAGSGSGVALGGGGGVRRTLDLGLRVRITGTAFGLRSGRRGGDSGEDIGSSGIKREEAISERVVVALHKGREDICLLERSKIVDKK